MRKLALIPLIVLLRVLASCGSPLSQPELTVSPSANAELTPTFESGTEDETSQANISIQISGAVNSAFTQALLTAEAGKDYILLLEQTVDGNPMQLRLILAANIEPGTYTIVSAQDFQLPEGATVAARFDLGFPATDLSGEFVLDSLGENNFTGSINLSAQDGNETLTVEGRFENLDAAIIG